METPLLVKLADAILIAAAALYLLLLRPWRPARLLRRLAPGVDLLFVLGLASGVAALHAATPFDRLAAYLVAETELPGTLMQLDARIESIEQLPARIWLDLKSRIGWIDDGTGPPPPAAPAAGIVTESVLPAVIGVVEVVVRAFTYWGALIVLAIGQVMRPLTGREARRAERLAERGPSLESRIAALERALVALQTPSQAPPLRAPESGAPA